MSQFNLMQPVRWVCVALCATLMSLATAEDAARQTPKATPEAQTAAAAKAPDYARDIQPIFNRRCVACHGCLGSPCNVKLDSFRGADRGGFAANPYASHLGFAERTDMDVVDSTAAWRERGFYPILHRDGDPDENLKNSLLFQLVESGMRHNGPNFDRKALDAFRGGRFAATCPATPESMADRLSQHPALGMPYGLPALSGADFETLRGWVAAGSHGPTQEQMSQDRALAEPKTVAAWEDFFNQPDGRHRLVSRYIFEHVFLATIVLDESPGERFRLVRSTTPPPGSDSTGRSQNDSPLAVIATDLPYDDPYEYAGVEQFWYRLQKITTPPVQKNLWLWRIGLDDIDKLRTLFLAPQWHPGADLDPPWGIGNPFLIFAAIPAEARARFLLENSEVIVGGITYGPVCNGQTATYAIKDQFWVFFLDPAHDVSVQDPDLGLETWKVFMDRSAFGNADYLEAYAKAQARLNPGGWSLDAIWDGGGDNRNAWLTILRHETNVSLLQGAAGGIPRTFWLISYSGLERMYYDTVASFRYWGSDAHKLETLLFFNFLRQEFEDNFLLLLPPETRQRTREQWTQGIGSIALAVVPFAGESQPTAISSAGGDPLISLLSQIEKRLGPRVSDLPDPLNPWPKTPAKLGAAIDSFDDWQAAVSELTGIKGQPFLPHLPSVIVLRLNDGADSRVYSLVANRVYKSQYTLVFDNGQALPKEDTLSVYPGLVNAFPNLFIDLDLERAPSFLDMLRKVETPRDWARFASSYAVLRNDAGFWGFYDWINAWNFDQRGQAAGWLDLSYYDAPEI